MKTGTFFFRGGDSDFELVHSKVANINIPQMVIAFYESRLSWSSKADDANKQDAKN